MEVLFKLFSHYIAIMTTKKCKQCGVEKSLDSFYKHPQKKDGKNAKCKFCVKLNVKSNLEKNMQNPDYVRKERARGREKYHRLNYASSQSKTSKASREAFKARRPWTDSAKYKGLNKKLKLPNGFQAHHWSYLDENLEDIFVLQKDDHRKAHYELKFDESSLCYQTLDGELLDSKFKHEQFLLANDIVIH